MSTTTRSPAIGTAAGARSAWNRIATTLSAWISHDLIALCARFAIAGIFFMSARTKVDGLLTTHLS